MSAAPWTRAARETSAPQNWQRTKVSGSELLQEGHFITYPNLVERRGDVKRGEPVNSLAPLRLCGYWTAWHYLVRGRPGIEPAFKKRFQPRFSRFPQIQEGDEPPCKFWRRSESLYRSRNEIQ